MEYLVLGPLEVVRDGERVALGSYKQRALLALLLMHANEVVSTDRIIDELWRGDGSADHQNALWVLVSKLRSALEPARGQRGDSEVLRTRAPGYVLLAGTDQVDAWRFRELVEDGRSLLDHDPTATSKAIAEGLALWRGHPYDDFTYESFAQAEIARLEEARLEAVELRVDADLRRGLAAELVGELEGLARQHPLRERPTALLMLALNRSGRQADALRAYSRLRSQLAEETGLEPSASMKRLEEDILGARPTGAPVTPTSRPALAIRGYELREELGAGAVGVTYRAYQPATGREVLIESIRPELANAPSFVRRFEPEAERVARLRHPRVVPIDDFWREPGAAYVVTPVRPNGTLADALREGPMAPAEAARMVEDVAAALTAAHRAGIVHHDIEPGNILLDREGHAALTGFAVGADAVPDGYASPEQRAHGEVTAASDVYGLAMVLRHALSGRPTDDATPTTSAISAALTDVIERATANEPSRRYPDVAAFSSAVHTALEAAPVGNGQVAVTNPYKGLRAFDESDAVDFFGRERLVDRLVHRLGAADVNGRFVALVGPSGSGKSSVVQAGLIPALRRGAVPGSASWFVVSVTPGAHPFEALETALLRVAVKPPTNLFELLTGGRSGIAAAVRQVLPGDAQLVLVVDQFEELFTQARAQTAQLFLDALAAVVSDPTSGVRVVVTLRADFYDRPLRHRAIGERFRCGTEVITPMAPEELALAVTGPVERIDVRFEPGVVSEIVADVADHAGALPLLQYALTELFDRRRGSTIDLELYREAGGASGALVRRAEALYAELDDDAREATRQVLLHLVTVGDGTDVVRQRVARRELADLGQAAVEMAVDTLGRHRLLTFDRDPVTREPTVEIAHEAVLAEWTRLRGWLDESRDDVRQYRTLAAATSEWRAAGGDDELLLRGARLDRLGVWARTTSLALQPIERRFLDSSVARREEERAAEEARRAREERLRRAARLRSRQLIGAAVVVALFAALAAFAFAQRSEADRLADEIAVTDEARRLALASINTGQDDAELATLLALASLDVSVAAGVAPVAQTEEALHWAIQARQLTYPVADAPVDVRMGPTGRTGIYLLPLTDLVDLARTGLARSFTADECVQFELVTCPPPPGTLANTETTPTVALPAAPTRPSDPATTRPPLAGTTITLALMMDAPAGLLSEFDRFEERTGIDIRFVSLAGNTNLEAPDLLVLPQPAMIQDGVRSGTAVDLSTYLDRADVERAFGEYLTGLVSHGSGLYGLPIGVSLKGLVWYPANDFAAAGYTVPATWAELMDLSRQIVADGRTPWCVGLEDGGASGWMGTDWLEALVLRMGGVEMYDRWAAHTIPFDDPVVQQAAARFGEVLFGDGFVRGGPALTTRLNFRQADPMFWDPPGCWFYFQADFMRQEIPPGARLGIDVDFFPLPPIDEGDPIPVFGGANLLAAARDRPEIREFVRDVLRPEWGEMWAGQPSGEFLPANVGFDVSRCADPIADAGTNEVRIGLCSAARDAIAAGFWRYDASDLMPTPIGAWDAFGRPGALLAGVLEYAERGPDNVAGILAGIDARWTAMVAASRNRF